MLHTQIQLDPGNPKPLYVQLSDMIVDYAINNQLEQGDLLPSENELLSRLDVSRSTVRSAIDRLVKLGMAKKIRGRGTTFIKTKSELPVHYHHAFNGSVERLGLTVANQLINNQEVSGQITWLEGFSATHWDKTFWIRRTKWAGKELLAMDERLLPEHVIKRYGQTEIENEDLLLDLMGKIPDTQTERFSYVFVSQPLTEEEGKLLKRPSGTCFLRRIGEYFNSIGERFMLSRLTIISDRINLRYEYVKQNGNWSMEG